MITIGITSYNRLELLKMMAKSFYSSNLCCPYNIRIYDDASTEYSIETLRELFPGAVSVVRHFHNLGSDANIYYMYQDFLNSNDEYFFNADSDLIFSNDWMKKGTELLKKTDGILSLLNVFSHLGVSDYGEFVEKNDIGSAGTFFVRSIVEDFVYNTDVQEIQNEGVDWRFCRYFREKGIKIYSTQSSLVQHIGIDGYNSDFRRFDYGKEFEVDSLVNGQIINNVIENIAKNYDKIYAKRRIKMFPFDLIPKGANVIIYGAGVTGSYYEKQIKATNYCNLVAVVDKNYKNMESVRNPADLTSLRFDFIVLATVRPSLMESMKADILKIIPDAKDTIVYTTSSHYLMLE